MNFFWPSKKPDSQWFSVGLASTFPDLDLDGQRLLETRKCGAGSLPGCKVFHAPQSDNTERSEVPISSVEENEPEAIEGLAEQVLVFQYRGKFHAIDHSCPHSLFPLSHGVTFDIEDFGVILSAGITCSKHGWSFDLFTGQSDKGNYQMKRWEVEVRDAKGEYGEKEVWVRRKQRIG